ncbi:hypothetical protein SD475_RS21615 [Escherichia coli]
MHEKPLVHLSKTMYY